MHYTERGHRTEATFAILDRRMFAFALAVLLSPPLIEQPPRLRAVLSNGSVVIVERKDDAKSTVVTLTASARGVEESPKRHGWRHLLEHILVKGPNRDVDTRLEARGGFLRARTMRDAMQIDVSVAPLETALALQVLGDILRGPKSTAEELAREVEIIRQETALEESTARLAAAAWTGAFGEDGLDPMGALEAIGRATPNDLRDLFAEHFRGRNLALVISGPVALDDTLATGRAFLAKYADTPSRANGAPRRQFAPKRVRSDASGRALAVAVDRPDDPATMARLGVALALASEAEDAFVTYTPGYRGGLIILGQRSGQDLPAVVKQGFSPSTGRTAVVALAEAWLMRQVRDEASSARFRGLLASIDPSLDPERLLVRIRSLRTEDVAAALEAYRSNVVEVEGR